MINLIAQNLISQAVSRLPKISDPKQDTPISKTIELDEFVGKAKEQGLTDDEVEQAYSQLRSKGIEVVGYKEIRNEYRKQKAQSIIDDQIAQQQTQQQTKSKGFLGNVAEYMSEGGPAKTVGTFLGGAGAEAVKGGMGIGKLGTDIIAGGIGLINKEAGEKAKEASKKTYEEGTKLVDKTIGGTTDIDTNSLAYKAGGIGTDIALASAPIPKTGAITKAGKIIAEKGGQFASELGKIPAIGGLVEGVAKLGGRAVSGGVKGAIDTAKFDIVAKGGLDKKDVENGVKLGAMLSAGAPILSALGKEIFGITVRPNTEQARKIIQTEIQGGKFKDTIPSTALEQGLMGTEKQISVGAGKKAKELWEKQVTPLLEKSKSTTNVDDSFKKLSEFIDNTIEPSEQKAYTDAFNKIYSAYKTEGNEMTLKTAQDIKSRLDSSISKAARDNKTGSPINVLKSELANIFRNDIHTKLGNEFGKDTRSLYAQYNNLKELQGFGETQITQGLRPFGAAGTSIGNLVNLVLTPISTTAGQTLYKVGNLMKENGKPIVIVGASGAKFLKDLTNKQGQQ